MKIFENKLPVIFWILLIILGISDSSVSPLDSTLPTVYSFFEQNGPFLTLESVLRNNFTQINDNCSLALRETEHALNRNLLWALKCKFMFKFHTSVEILCNFSIPLVKDSWGRVPEGILSVKFRIYLFFT